MLGTWESAYQLEQIPYNLDLFSQNLTVFIHFSRYNAPDPHLTREYDTYLRLDMMSLQYVHVKRFIDELNGFFRKFSQLQRILDSVRSARQVSNLQLKKSIFVIWSFSSLRFCSRYN